MGSLLAISIQLFWKSIIVEMNIDEICALQKCLWCDAANPKSHNSNKKGLSFQHGCQQSRQLSSNFDKNSVKSRT